MSGIAACALLLALAAVVAAARDGRGGTVLLAIGCVSVGTLMLAHGLTTPGMLGQPVNMWVGRLGALALISFAFWLSAATWEDGPLSRLVAQAPTLSLATAVTVLLVGSAVIAIDPTVLSGTAPLPAEDLVRTAVPRFRAALALFVIGAIHWRRWRLGRDRIELSLGWPAGCRCRRSCRSASACSGACRGGTTTCTC